nr:hypothetical protein [Mycobacterium asiaticum]
MGNPKPPLSKVRSALAISALTYAAAPPFSNRTNSALNAAAWLLTAWKSWPKAPNTRAMAAEISSLAAAAIPVVGPAAVAAASLSEERRFAS